MSLIVYGLIALAIMGAIGTGVYKVKQWGANEVRQEWSDANEDARAREVMASINAAKDLSDARVKRRIVIQEVTTYVDKIVERAVYSNVCLDASGLRCLDAAILGQSAAGCKPDGAMPAAPTPD